MEYTDAEEEDEGEDRTSRYDVGERPHHAAYTAAASSSSASSPPFSGEMVLLVAISFPLFHLVCGFRIFFPFVRSSTVVVVVVEEEEK